MPISAKGVLILYGLYLILSIGSIFMGDTGPALFRMVVTLGVFTGLCARSIIAWHWARWTSAFSFVILLSVSLLAIGSLLHKPSVAIVMLLSIILSLSSFLLLGKKDARAYFTRRETKEIQPSGPDNPAERGI